MNSSQRRGPVIAWAITAAALYGAVGVGPSGLAVADDSRPDPGAGGDSATPGASNDPGPRRHTRSHPGSGQDGGWRPGEHHCPWWPRPIPPMPPVSPGDTRNNSGLIAPSPVISVPVPVFGDGAQSRTGVSLIPPGEPAAAAPAVVAPAASRAPHAVAAPVARPPQTPPMFTAPVPRSAAPEPPASPLRGPIAEPAAPARLGYPDELRDADLAKVVSVALPGLAAIAGMTAFGGLVGYRQARAGYLVHAAGAGRFLR